MTFSRDCAGGAGLIAVARGAIDTHAGALVASVAQAGHMRIRGTPPPPTGARAGESAGMVLRPDVMAAALRYPWGSLGGLLR